MKIQLLFLVCALCSFRLTGQNDSITYYTTSAISSTVPNAYARGYLGTIGIGGNILSTTRLSDKAWDPDVNTVLTIGLANPEKLVGIDLRVNIYGTSNNRGEKSNLGEGTVDIHLNRKLNDKFWLGVGGYDLFGWHTSEINSLQSYHAELTSILPLKKDNIGFFSKMWITLGVGNGRFRTDKNYSLPHSGKFNIFSSVVLQVLPRANIIAEWNGYGVYTGISLIPFKQVPFQMIIGGDDLSNAQRAFVVGLAYGFNLKKKLVTTPYLPSPPLPQSSRV